MQGLLRQGLGKLARMRRPLSKLRAVLYVIFRKWVTGIYRLLVMARSRDSRGTKNLAPAGRFLDT
jgi:hypothetical protein